jgi:hypothetical protein
MDASKMIIDLAPTLLLGLFVGLALSIDASKMIELAPTLLLGLFFGLLLLSIAPHLQALFLKRHARGHRLAGLAHLICLLVGYADLLFELFEYKLAFDLTMGVLGTTATLTAAFDFQHHKHAKNEASGTLDVKSTVTYNEMMEHSFYQMLNFVQILYLHTISSRSGQALLLPYRCALLLLATSPWLLRHRFPVNHFSDNYIKEESLTLTSFLYFLKKGQYLLYKHALLHGLNASLALRAGWLGDSVGARPMVHTSYFRCYWLALNSAYVMEFFLQTLVKKKVMAQATMVMLNQLLMLASTVVALQVVAHHVLIQCAGLSLLLNIVHRGHEMPNMVCILLSVLPGIYMGQSLKS